MPLFGDAAEDMMVEYTEYTIGRISEVEKIHHRMLLASDCLPNVGMPCFVWGRWRLSVVKNGSFRVWELLQRTQTDGVDSGIV